MRMIRFSLSLACPTKNKITTSRCLSMRCCGWRCVRVDCLVELWGCLTVFDRVVAITVLLLLLLLFHSVTDMSII